MPFNYGNGEDYIPANARQEAAMTFGGRGRRNRHQELSRAEAAKVLGVTPGVVSYHVKTGALKPYRVDGAAMFFRSKDVKDFATARMVARGLKAAK